MTERGEEEDVDVDVEHLEQAESAEDPEVAVERESLTGSPETTGPGSRPRTRGVEEARATGATSRMT